MHFLRRAPFNLRRFVGSEDLSPELTEAIFRHTQRGIRQEGEDAVHAEYTLSVKQARVKHRATGSKNDIRVHTVPTTRSVDPCMYTVVLNARKEIKKAADDPNLLPEIHAYGNREQYALQSDHAAISFCAEAYRGLKSRRSVAVELGSSVSET